MPSLISLQQHTLTCPESLKVDPRSGGQLQKRRLFSPITADHQPADRCTSYNSSHSASARAVDQHCYPHWVSCVGDVDSKACRLRCTSLCNHFGEGQPGWSQISRFDCVGGIQLQSSWFADVPAKMTHHLRDREQKRNSYPLRIALARCVAVDARDKLGSRRTVLEADCRLLILRDCTGRTTLACCCMSAHLPQSLSTRRCSCSLYSRFFLPATLCVAPVDNQFSTSYCHCMKLSKIRSSCSHVIV